MAAPTYIWSSHVQAAGGSSNSQTDFTLPAATSAQDRVLVVMLDAVADGTVVGYPSSTVAFTATYSTDPTFMTGVTTFDTFPSAGSGYTFAQGSIFAADWPTIVLGFVAWASLPNGATGYVRITSSMALNHVTTLWLLGNTSLAGTPNLGAQANDEANPSTTLNPQGWPGISGGTENALGVNTPDAIILATDVVVAPHTLTVSGSWGQTEVANAPSAGGVYGTEARVAMSYSFPNSGSNQSDGFGGYYTGAQWVPNSTPARHYVWAIFFYGLARKGRAWCFVLGL